MKRRSRLLLVFSIIMTTIILAGTVCFADTDSGENAERIPIFTYHRFCTPEKYKTIKSCKSLTVPTDKLEEQMKFLSDNGYRTISAQEFYDWYTGKIELPRKTVMITMDDAKYSTVKYGAPIFKKYGIKTTNFVIGNRTKATTNKTEGDENRNHLGFDIIDTLNDEYPDFDLQSHTYGMHRWRKGTSTPRAYFWTEKMCYDDMAKMSDMFDFEFLAYPFGAYTDDFINAMKAEGSIKMAFTYGNDKYATRDQDPYKIERIKVSGMKSMDEFTRWLDEGTPKLKMLKSSFTKKDSCKKINNTIRFESGDGEEYIIMRKGFLGSWEDVGRVTAKGLKTEWTDKGINIQKRYRYTVKKILYMDGDEPVCGPYDEKGLKTLNKYVTPKVEYTTRTARVTFRRNIGVDGYKVFRKTSDTDWTKLEDKNQRKKPTIIYTDEYIKTKKKNNVRSKLTFSNFIDPSENDLVYSARPFIKENGAIILGPMLEDGDFYMTEPNIVSVNVSDDNKAEYKFGTCPNASSYILYSGCADDNGKVDWREVGTTKKHGDGYTLTVSEDVESGDDCFAVKAVYKKNGKTIESDMEETYTTRYRNYEGAKLLVIGASGSYGCPYKDPRCRFVFSYPYRMGDMLGAEVVNPSIPGATYSTLPEKRKHIGERIVEPIVNGEEIDKSSYGQDVLDRNLNHYKLTDFDIVLVVAGGNDYNVNMKPGDSDSTDTSTFSGAVNEIMDTLQKASDERVKDGRKATAVVMVGTTYSNRRGDYTEDNNRYETENSIGYTLMDFENAFQGIYDNRKADGMNVCYMKSEDYLNADNCATATTDNLHMNRCTNAEFGAYLASEFASQGMLD